MAGIEKAPEEVTAVERSPADETQATPPGPALRVLFATMQFGRGYGQGTERYVAILSDGLRRRGHAVTVLAGDPERRGPSLPAGAPVDGEPGVLHLPSRGWMSVEGLPPEAFEPLLRRERPDVVHVANPAHIGVGLLHAAARTGIPTVVTIMDYWWLCPKHTLQHWQRGTCDGNVGWRECARCIAAGRRDALSHLLSAVPGVRNAALPALMFLRSVMRGLPVAEIRRWKGRQQYLLRTLRSVDAVICPSQAAAALVGSRVDSGRVHAIPYGLEARWFEGRPTTTTRTSDAKDPEGLTIGYAGALARHKGVHLLLEAVRRLGWTQTRVRLAGGGDDKRYLQHLRELAAGLRVEFVGRLPSDRMPEFFRSLDVLVVPSLWPENLPIVMLEAQACGLPVLGSRSAGIAEMISDPGCLFDVGSAADLADRLAAWARRPTAASAGAVSTAATMIDRTLEVYQAVCRAVPDCGEPKAPSTGAGAADAAWSNGIAPPGRLRRLRRCIAPDGSTRHRALRATNLRAQAWWFRARARLRRLGLPVAMSWHAFAFDRFKRMRARLCGGSLEALRVPAQEGLVSIVLPVFNGEPYLRESLDSILAQTYRSFELIVVDDGSTDGTPRILAAYAAREPRMRVLTQANQKLPCALSRGFRMARGEFLTWTSADNRMRPDFLARMVACMRRHSAWDMAYANEDIIDEAGRPLSESEWFPLYQQPVGSPHIHFPTDASELNTRSDNYVGAAFLYHARVPFLLGEYSRWRFGLEDYDYWMRINDLLNLRHADFDEPVYEYRLHGRSLTSRAGELSGPRNRRRLNVFDDFRRDSCAGPLVFRIEGGETGAAVVGFVEGLRRAAAAAGHLTPDWTCIRALELPRLWVPVVYVRAVGRSKWIKPPPDELPRSALKVLVAISDGPLPPEVPPEWDLCLAWSAAAEPQHTTPPWQGWLATSDMDALLAVIDIRARSGQWALIEAEAAAPPVPAYRFSVIICTNAPGDSLAQVIRSVARQDIAVDEYEIIVVDGGAQEGVQALVKRLRGELFAKSPERLRYVTCPVPGPGHAWNAGIAEARGEILCFLPDDAEPAEDWLAQTWAAYRDHPRVGVVGGWTMLRLRDPIPDWLAPDWWPYWGHFCPNVGPYAEVQEWRDLPRGANWTARRCALVEIGGFRTALTGSGAADNWWQQFTAACLIRSLGYTITITPRSRVYRDVEAGRFTIEHVQRKILDEAELRYRCAQDLYQPMEGALGGAWRLGRATLGALSAFAATRADRARHFAHVRAEAMVLWRRMGDEWRRRRPPLAGAE